MVNALLPHAIWVIVVFRVGVFIALKEWRPGPPTLPKWLREP